MTPARPIARPIAVALCAALVLAGLPTRLPAQSPPSQSPAPPPAQPAPSAPAQSSTIPQPGVGAAKLPTSSQRRRAAKLYMQAAALYQNQQFEKALDLDREAAKLDPTNPDYSLAAEIARSHAVTALIQQAARHTTESNPAAARAALARALELDPGNQAVIDHIRALADNSLRDEPESDQRSISPQFTFAPPLRISPRPETHSFHLNAGVRQIIPQVFSAYGIDATVDSSVRDLRVRFDIDDASFEQAARAISLLATSFYAPIDAHRVIVARDNATYQLQFQHNALDTVYLAGLSANEMTDMGNVARNVFDVRQISVDSSSGTLTLRGPVDTLDAFNATYTDLLEGRSEVLLDVRLIQIAHNNALSTGLQLPQTITAYNVYTEEKAILKQNAALVQQIIASGLVAPGDTLAILGILIASGAVPAGLFANGILVFGGGLTQTALVPNSGLTLKLNVNSSDSRALDNYRIRLEDGEEGTLKAGTRYPIMTSSYSNLGISGLNIPGLNGAGNSSSLAGLLASSNLASANIPQFQYEDLGLVLKARPRVFRSGDVALNLDLKITALAGTSVNNVPVLANRSYTGAVTIPVNQAVVLASEIDKTQSHAISGYPGLSEIPGFDNVTSKDIGGNYATLLIILIPHIVRSSHPAGRTPMLRVDKTPRNR